MELNDPVAIYSAKTNAEARVYWQMLLDAGIEARVAEDPSIAGLPFGMAVGHPDSSKVWVAGADADRAAEILKSFDKTRAEREPEQAAGIPGQTIITAVCEECGESSMFSAILLGSVQECPHCGRFMDVAAGGDDLEWGDPEDEEKAEPDEE